MILGFNAGISNLKNSFTTNKTVNLHKYNNLSPLLFDTVSFRAKPSEFGVLDFAIQKKFHLNLSKDFKTKEDFQNWCNNKTEEYFNKDYSSKKEKTTENRNKKLNEWFNYLKNSDNGYTPAAKLLIIDGITKDLKYNNNNEPPKLNPIVLSDTISEIKHKNKRNAENINFLKLYKQIYNQTQGNGWLTIKSKENDPDNFKDNVEKLKTLSHHNWCTKSYKAEPYLAKGDFHIYMEYGQPKLGVRFENDTIQEIQGELNNSKIPVQYLDIAKEHIKDNKLNSNTENEIKSAEYAKMQVNEFKTALNKPIEETSVEELLKMSGIQAIRDKQDGLLIIDEYHQPSEYFTWEDLGVNENNIFKAVKEITNDASFQDSKINSFNNLKKIKGEANFLCSSINSLGALEEIGNDACFVSSNIRSLGNLKKIKGDVYFMDSKITSFDNLEEIDGCCFIGKSLITPEMCEKRGFKYTCSC